MIPTKIFGAMHILSGHFVPYPQENNLKGVDLISLNTAMHITPFANLIGSCDVIIRNIHSAGISYFAVNNNNFAVVTVKDMVDPRKTYRIKLINFYAFRTYGIQMLFP